LLVRSTPVDLIVIDRCCRVDSRAEIEAKWATRTSASRRGYEPGPQQAHRRDLPNSECTVVSSTNPARKSAVMFRQPRNHPGGRATQSRLRPHSTVRRTSPIKEAEVAVGARTAPSGKNKIAAFRDAGIDLMFDPRQSAMKGDSSIWRL